MRSFPSPVFYFRLLTIIAAFVAITPANAAPEYKFKTLHSFCKFTGCADGEGPEGALLLNSVGAVYGAANGGKYGNGLVYRLESSGTGYTEAILHNFCKNGFPSCKEGYTPVGDLVMDKKGVLYEVTNRSIVSLTHGDKGWVAAVLHTFNGNQLIYSGLAYQGQQSGKTWDDSSPLIGVSESGGKYNNGYVYTFKPNGSGWTLTDIHNFQTAFLPNRPLVDAAGNVFGTAEGGGKYNGGEMYKLAAGTWKESILWSFCSEGGDCPNGTNPIGQPVMDASGNLFTATLSGGIVYQDGCIETSTCGVIFERTAGGGGKVLYRFCSALGNCADGETPDTTLTLDTAGDLFGVTSGGGTPLHCEQSIGCGVAFELMPNGDGSWSEYVLHSFCNSANCADGGVMIPGEASGPLSLDNAGDLFGTVPSGGKYGDAQEGGTAFELTPQ